MWPPWESRAPGLTRLGACAPVSYIEDIKRFPAVTRDLYAHLRTPLTELMLGRTIPANRPAGGREMGSGAEKRVETGGGLW